MKRLFHLFFLFFWLVAGNIYPQDESKTIADTLEIEKHTIPVGEIPSRTEELSGRFVELKEQIKPSAEIYSIDTILDASMIQLNQEKELIYSDSSDQSYRSLSFDLKEWEGYENQLSKIQGSLESRSDKIKDVSDEINEYLSVWQETKDESVQKNVSKEVLESIDEVIETINSIIINVNMRSDSLFLIQKKLTEQALLIDEVIHEISIRQENLQSNYFVIDSPEIWNAKDSVSTYSLIKETVNEGLRHDATTLRNYLLKNRATVILAILGLLFLLILLIYLKRKWFKYINPQKSKLDANTLVILSNPIASVLAIGILISAFFFTNSPPIFGELTIIALLITVVYLLPKLSVKRLRLLLFLLLILLLVHLAGNYIGVRSFGARVASFFSAFVMLFILINFRISKYFESFYSIKRSKWLIFTIYLFLILVVLGIVANIIGSVNLSNFIISGVLLSIVFGTITRLAVEIFSNIILLLVREDAEKKIQKLSSFKLLLQKRLKPFLNWGGFILWVYLTLVGFNVISYVKKSLSDFMEIKWKIGELTISLGGIFSFLIIILFTVLVTKIISNILKEEWIENSALPKGSSPAISIVLRILVVVLGLYLAASAAGIDLSKLGFIVGALSVGIGFGLQSVVLNFIAGLILAFERPIHVGDVVQADTEMGTVSEIGVRASKIETWDGTEVIIPNGDLVSKKVINYTLSNEKRRFKVPFRTTLDADPKQVMEILTTIAKNHPNTLENPAPKTYFWGYGDASLDFFLYFWTEFSVGLSTRGAIMLEIHEKFEGSGIKIAIPIRKMQIDKEDEDDITPQSS